MKLEELVFRAWYYFRNGYSTYLSFPVGFLTFISTTYYLAIKNIPFLQDIFSRFYLFAIVAVIIIFPLGVLIGWLHMKRTLAYPTQVAITVESNPYNYKIRPGKEAEINYPLWYLMLRILERLSEKEGVLTSKEKKEFEELREKIERLKRGEVIGAPRQRKIVS
ncbi:hypothetical protein J7L60_01420 [Candidatus Bathyarchaeota archaeon]|nr:hypothetical protein [Candidatus Bathyarchaeota archaeon]